MNFKIDLKEHKDLYIDTMRNVSAKGDWESWCAFFLNAVARQAEQNLKIAENIRALYEDMKHLFSEILSSKWSVRALDFMFTHPVFRNNHFTSQSEIPTPTAARFTRALLDRGLLHIKEAAAGRRAAMYSFEPLMQLVRV